MPPVNDDFTKIIQSLWFRGPTKVYEDLNLSLLRHRKIWQKKQHIFSRGSLLVEIWQQTLQLWISGLTDWPLITSESTSLCGICQSIHGFSKSPNHNTHHRLSVLTLDGLNLTDIFCQCIFHLTGNYPASWLVKGHGGAFLTPQWGWLNAYGKLHHWVLAMRKKKCKRFYLRQLI